MEIKTYCMGRMKEYNNIGVNEMMRIFNKRTRIRHFHITWVQKNRHTKDRLLVVSVLMRVFNKKTRIPHFPKWKLRHITWGGRRNTKT
jgi:hypothetical protein